MGDRMLRPRKVSLLTPQVRGQEGDVLTNAGSQLQQHVVAAQLGKQLQQSAYRGARASLPGVQQPASGVGVRLQLPDLQVLKVHLLRQRGPVGRHLCPHPWRAVLEPRRGRVALSASASSFSYDTRPAPPRRLSLSEKRRPALQSGAPRKSAEAGAPTSTLEVWRRGMWEREK
uniref:Uncharacterized protein n=1 Tax=Mandrillus leucophaeus TaxID=9568 RepID=A0A2K5ZKT8_MANLE